MEDDGMADEILQYALKGAQEHENMTGNARAKDAFFDGIMAKSIQLHTKKHLLKAYGPAFVCQDPNCKVCNWYVGVDVGMMVQYQADSLLSFFCCV
jgi:hypothetical protein